jgi:phosphopantetheinyl transferase (holo-ACP synthase)
VGGGAVSAPWELPTPAPPPLLSASQSEGGREVRLSEVGVDVMSADRLSRALKRSPRLFERLCAPEERWEWTAPEGAGLAWACALWCAKEAAVKTLRTGFWREGIDWPMVVVGAEPAHLLCERSPSLDLTAARALDALTAQEVWSAWGGWRRVSLRAEAGRRWGERALWCCALEREGVVWGWGALSAPPQDAAPLDLRAPRR